ncbi:MAG TPA: hypothetical protein VF064_21135 [Pyrinomonadaceae bacterium]
MRTIKMLAVAVVLALTGAIYAAGAMQDAAKTKDPAKAPKSCCRKHGGAQTAAHAGMKHEGCCAGGACSKDHTGGHAQTATPKTAAAGEEKAGCCGGSCCCAGGSCGKEHKGAGARAAADGESCCKNGAAFCKGGGENCCKTHKPDAKHAAQQPSVEKNEGCGSCACCAANKADHKAHAGGR